VFSLVLFCLILSVLSTVENYSKSAAEALFLMVSWMENGNQWI
jgi:hypothetical protein